MASSDTRQKIRSWFKRENREENINHGRELIDTELKKFGFVPFEIPSDFKGVPDDVLEGLEKQLSETQKSVDYIEEEKQNMAQAHADMLRALLASFAIAAQIVDVQNELESTSLVYRLTGWIPTDAAHAMMKDLDKLSTCDMNATINNGLSEDSKEALKGKRGEDIVNADVASQGYEATKAETDRNIEIQ